ncbi:MAG: S8 family serine peptidase [Flavobacteriaceae bacterium]
MKKKFLLLTSLFLVGCASVRFKGDPIITNNRQAISTQIDAERRNHWARLDLLRDSIPGMSVNRAYKELIQNKKGDTVVVAIIDSGMDIDHPALVNQIWINTDEIPNNQIDDDQNGYVDDVNGWNFLGASENENLEYVRLQKLEQTDSEAFDAFEEKRQKELKKYTSQLANVLFLIEEIPLAKKKIQEALGKEDFTLEEASQLSPLRVELSEALRLLAYVEEADISAPLLQKALKQYQDALLYHHNIDFEGRSIVGDDPDNINDKSYGDARVWGPKEADIDHGTHVAGIIGAVAWANGSVGIATNVKLMPLRAIPNGDEYDKDIALAIRYAVDNGAKIINASFGKGYSPHANWVYEAIRYAADHDVLIVHAAGNDNENIDPGFEPNFPSDYSNGNEIAGNVITVGASTWDYNQDLIASFSNFGKINVDVFAPGYKIYSSTPNKQYDRFDGTSMAAPNVSGVAAVLRSFYPKYKAAKIKKIILDSGLPMYSQLKVPSGDGLEKPKYFSQSGKIVNLYNALLAASK